jgi:hypothetical protein
MAEPIGQIRIDDVAINDLGLHDVRGAMAIIPQVRCRMMYVQITKKIILISDLKPTMCKNVGKVSNPCF